VFRLKNGGLRHGSYKRRRCMCILEVQKGGARGKGEELVQSLPGDEWGIQFVSVLDTLYLGNGGG